MPEDTKYPPVKINLKLMSARDYRDLRVKGGLTAETIDNPMGAEEPEKAFQAMAWIATRRDYPDVTFEEAFDIDFILDDDWEPDPTKAASSAT